MVVTVTGDLCIVRVSSNAYYTTDSVQTDILNLHACEVKAGIVLDGSGPF